MMNFPRALGDSVVTPRPLVLSLLLAVSCLSLTITHAEPWKPISLRIPPRGIEISAEERANLQESLDTLTARLKKLQHPAPSASIEAVLPDIEIYHKAVTLALRFGEFYRPGDVKTATEAIQTATKRLELLQQGKHPWTQQRGLVVRGYRSNIDGSAQPYGLEIPEKLDLSKPCRLYVWLHGRGDKTTDLHFIHQRETRPGRLNSDNGIVLHPFGRHCMGFKSAGEIDVLNAIASVSKRYKIDPDRIALMGFSMGGAGAWHLGAHYADRWAVVHAGAGFAETRRYNKMKPADYPSKHAQILWGLYDVPGYVRNLFNLPVVAYSGENDKQIQAARIMEEAYQQHGQTLPHIIGPGMGHRYHPDSLAEVMQRVDQALDAGRNRFPTKLSLQTRTLRYSRMHWLEVTGLKEHWKEARVDADLTDEGSLVLKTRNVQQLRIRVPPDKKTAFPIGFQITIDGQKLSLVRSRPEISLTKVAGWMFSEATSPISMLRKQPGLQGPIDDAFQEPFLVVTPSGKSRNPAVQKWVEFELAHFLERWRSLYRGVARTKKDTEVTAEDLERYHLVLWGDTDSNALLAKVAGDLPIKHSRKSLEVAGKTYSREHHVPLLIYPNPANPQKYVVLNSGPTHREDHDRTNSLQNPKLPDWAILNVQEAPTAEAAGRIVAADFFDESWQIKSAK